MPVVTTTKIEGYASCRDGRCPGYLQERVELVETETSFSYMDLGGDIPGIERTTKMYQFADTADMPCKVCGEPRLCSDQVRPIYANISGIPQDALLQVNRDSIRVREMEMENLKRDNLIERQTAALERQERQIQALTEDLATRPRGPGRPRKPPEE